MLITTDAIVLKRIPFSDTSLICKVFTKTNPMKSINLYVPINEGAIHS